MTMLVILGFSAGFLDLAGRGSRYFVFASTHGEEAEEQIPNESSFSHLPRCVFLKQAFGNENHTRTFSRRIWMKPATANNTKTTVTQVISAAAYSLLTLCGSPLQSLAHRGVLTTSVCTSQTMTKMVMTMSMNTNCQMLKSTSLVEADSRFIPATENNTLSCLTSSLVLMICVRCVETNIGDEVNAALEALNRFIRADAASDYREEPPSPS